MVEQEFGTIACIIRTFNNAPDPTRNAVHRAFQNGVGQVILVVNDEATDGRFLFKQDVLDPLKDAYRDRLVIILIQDGYGWASALNAAISFLRWQSTLSLEPAFDFVLFASTPVEWTQEHLFALRRCFADRLLGFVGATFAGFRGDSREAYQLGLSYEIPRFTFSLARWSAIMDVGFVDTASDSFGGMEDYDFLIRMLALTVWSVARSKVRVPVLIGGFEDPDAKERRCQEAMRRIESRLRCFAGSHPELQEAIASAISRMGSLCSRA